MTLSTATRAPRPAAPARRLFSLGALACVFALAGCASMSARTPEELVAQRAQERWDALIARNFSKAYGYLQPQYRKDNTLEKYVARFGDAGAWKAVQIHETTCEPERCTVRVRLTSANYVPNFAKAMPEITSYFDEIWVREDGRWWFNQVQ